MSGKDSNLRGALAVGKEMDVLCLPEQERHKLKRWAMAAYPEESCGLLIGMRHETQSSVLESCLVRNVAKLRLRDRYELDPVGYLAVEEDASGRGLTVVGIWHTHPDHPARPSETDRELAWEGWSYLIAAVTADGVTEMRSWRLNGDHVFEEEEIRP